MKTCFWAHKWGKWSEVKKEVWVRTMYSTGKNFDYIRDVQERVCERCNIIERFYLDGR